MASSKLRPLDRCSLIGCVCRTVTVLVGIAAAHDADVALPAAVVRPGKRVVGAIWVAEIHVTTGREDILMAFLCMWLQLRLVRLLPRLLLLLQWLMVSVRMQVGMVILTGPPC